MLRRRTCARQAARTGETLGGRYWPGWGCLRFLKWTSFSDCSAYCCGPNRGFSCSTAPKDAPTSYWTDCLGRRYGTVLLAAGRADLAAARSTGTVSAGVADDPRRRAELIRAARFDRQDTDLGLLRYLLTREADQAVSDEFRLAAVLVALHGKMQDYEFLRGLSLARDQAGEFLGSLPGTPETMTTWALELNARDYGQDPARISELSWARLARQQGLVEIARCALIRLLDNAGPRHERAWFAAVGGEFDQLGDDAQAARARDYGGVSR